jgi:uncharacterized damage-inducible protein DinB
MTPTQSILFNHLFENNHEMIQMLVKDITQAESMLQLPFEGNCLNWVVGHILDTYSICLEWLGQPAIRSEAEARTYGYGSEPMTDPAKACDLIEMLERLDLASKQIMVTLASLTTAELEGEIEIWRGKVSLIEALFFMQWHASYHTGQLEQLRELAGKNDQGA